MPIRIGILINDFESLVPSQSSASLIATFAGQEEETWVFGVGDLGVDPHGRVVAQARALRRNMWHAQAAVEALRTAEPTTLVLEHLDGLLVRTNPPRDGRPGLHATALQLLRFIRDRGVVVLNDPDGLKLASSKLYLALLPPFTRPHTIASANPRELRQFVRGRTSHCVLKPAVGTRGRRVFRVGPDEKNLNEIIEGLVEYGTVIAQEFVPAAEAGDTRVIVVGGQIFEIDGAAAAVHRVPSRDDFRSNIHVGGEAQPGTVTPAMRRVVDAIGPMLVRHGLFMVGLDFIGDVVCEINAFSAGGFPDFERFTGKPFTREFVNRVCAFISESVSSEMTGT